MVLTVAIGVSLYFGSTTRPRGYIRLQRSIKFQGLVLAVSSIIPLLIMIFGFSYLIAFLGFTFYTSFLIHTFTNVEKEKSQDLELSLSNVKDHVDSDSESEEEIDKSSILIGRGIFYLFLGGFLIMIFSEPFIVSISEIAISMKINPTLLAFFLAPVASEMPEILESISLSLKGNSNNINIAISNLIGGTITKTTLLMAVFSIFGIWKNISWESPNYTINLMMMIICSIFVGLVSYLAPKQSKIHSLLLFALFFSTCFIQYFFNSNFV